MKLFRYLFLIIAQAACAQVSFTFENGFLSDWIQVPDGRWEIIETPTNSRVLHHAFDNPESGRDAIFKDLTFPDLNDTISFSFQVRHGYNPSKNNHWQMRLFANDVSQCDGFLFGVNCNTSDDLLKLWQVYNGEVYEVFSTKWNMQDSSVTEDYTHFRLQRFPSGLWKAELLSANMAVVLGEGQELNVQSGRYFGIQYAYSSAQDRKLWIDDIYIRGTFYRDTLPPQIISHKVSSQNSLLFSFSEAVLSGQNTAFRWNTFFPDSLVNMACNLQVYYPQVFPNRQTQEVFVSGLTDFDGNQMKDTIIQVRLNMAEFGDLLINEIMFDPEPEVYLPSCEYLELFNRSEEVINIESWLLKINEKSFVLPEYCIAPGKYLILLSDKAQCALRIDNTLPFFTSSAVFPNSGAEISLSDSLGKQIHISKYEFMEYEDQWKSEGGWSLEHSDPDYLCGGEQILKYSVHPAGGTPGMVNSQIIEVNDNASPVISSISFHPETGLSLNFSEYILITASENQKLLLDDEALSLPYHFFPIATRRLHFDASTISQVYSENELKVAGFSDYSGNVLEDISFRINYPKHALFGEVLITEVMFDPLESQSEYIEIYNNSEKILDMYDLKLQLFELGEMPDEGTFLSGEHRLFFPGSYVVLVRNPEKLREEWELAPEEDLLKPNEWKSLDNSAGCIKLNDRSGNTLDVFCYDEEMHHDMLAFTDGVALERIHFAECEHVENCWMSAAASVSYGTPGHQNSQFAVQDELGKLDFGLCPEVFSPDMDGIDDFTKIHIPAGFQNGLVQIRVSDLNGVKYRNIAVDELLGVSSVYVWDGLDDLGRLVLPGLYIVHIEVKGEGYFMRRKMVCAVKYR